MNILELIDKSKIHAAYEYEFRRGTNASQTARNINEVCADGLRGFSLVISVLKTNPVVGCRPTTGLVFKTEITRLKSAKKIDNDELKAVVEEDTSQIMCALAERFNDSIPTVLDHLKQIGKVKKLHNWAPHELKKH